MGRQSGKTEAPNKRRVRHEKSRKPRPGRHLREDTKHLGDVAEMQFMIDAATRKFGFAKPFGDNERYDVILDAPCRLWRVQVKLCNSLDYNGFGVKSSWRTTNRDMPYTPSQIDFLAALVQCWRTHGKRIRYLIPVRALRGRLNISVYPYGSRKGTEGCFEKYREAWHLLKK
jgi:hypothetical protein